MNLENKGLFVCEECSCLCFNERVVEYDVNDLNIGKKSYLIEKKCNDCFRIKLIYQEETKNWELMIKGDKVMWENVFKTSDMLEKYLFIEDGDVILKYEKKKNGNYYFQRGMLLTGNVILLGLNMGNMFVVYDKNGKFISKKWE